MLGKGDGLRREMCCEVGGRASALRGGAKVCGKGGNAREGCVAVRGREKVFGGEWVVRSAGLTHFRRCHSRVRVLLYIRPPCPRREIVAMGTKDASCEHPSPAKTSAPAPSSFIFPRRRSHFSRIPFGLPLNDVRPCRSNVHTSAPAFTLPPHGLRRRPRRLPHPPRPRLYFRARVHISPAYPSAARTKTSAFRSSSYPQWVIHGKVIHIVARRPVQNVLALAPAHAYI